MIIIYTDENFVIETLHHLEDMLPEMVDYAELIGSPVPSSYGMCYVWEQPESYFIDNAIKIIESQQKEIIELKKKIESIRNGEE